MNSVPEQKKAQLAGIDRVFFIEHNLVMRWPVVRGGELTSAHGLRTGEQFAQLPATAYTTALDAEGSDSQHGVSFNQVLEGWYHGEDAEALAQLARMHGRRYLVLLRYFNGTIAAIGDRLNGLLFTTKYSSGKKTGERKGHTWHFEAATATAAVYLTKPFQVEGLGTVTPGQTITPPDERTGNVIIRNRRGRVLAIARPADIVTITSAFKVTISIQ